MNNSVTAGQFKSGSFNTNYLYLIFPSAVLLLFFLIPVISVFKGTSPAALLSVFTDSYYLHIITFTVFQALLSAFFSILAGLPGAWIMAGIDFKGKKLIRSLTTIPFVLPSILVVLGFVLTFGNSGYLNRFVMALTGTSQPPLKILYSFKAIILAHVFYNFPVSLRLISSAWSQIPENRYEAAKSLSAGKIRIFRTVTLPSLIPAVLVSFSLIFIFCFMSFAVILVLGGGPALSTIEVEIYRLARINLDINAAAALAGAGAVLTTVFTAAYIFLQKNSSGNSMDSGAGIKKIRFSSLSSPARLFAMVYILFIILIIAGPLTAVIVRSFQTQTGWGGKISYTLRWYEQIMTPGITLKAIKNTLLFGAGSLLISLPAGLSAAWVGAKSRGNTGRIIEIIFMLPIGISTVVLGLGYFRLISILPENFIKSGILIIFAHSVIGLPFIVRSLTASFRKINPSMIDAARSLGADTARVFFDIELPLVISNVISAAAFGFCISAGEINSAIILSDGGILTIPIAIYRLISSYNFFGACAMGTILMLICVISLYIIEKTGNEELF